MPANRHVLQERYRRMREELLSAIEGLSDELLTVPSLDGWSVKDHLAHLALWDDIRAAEVARISAGYDSAWRLTPDQDAAFNLMAHEARRSLSCPQVKWELAESRQRLIEAISVATRRGLEASLYGEAGLTSSHEVQHSGWIRRWRAEHGL